MRTFCAATSHLWTAYADGVHKNVICLTTVLVGTRRHRSIVTPDLYGSVEMGWDGRRSVAGPTKINWTKTAHDTHRYILPWTLGLLKASTRGGWSIGLPNSHQQYYYFFNPWYICSWGSLKIKIIHKWVQIISPCSQWLARCRVTIQRSSAAPAPKLSGTEKLLPCHRLMQWRK